jgi:hypothetical protein
MTEKHQPVAYLATLLAIVTLVGLDAILAYNGKSVEAVGVAAAVTGLIGVIKLPSQRNAPSTIRLAIRCRRRRQGRKVSGRQT